MVNEHINRLRNFYKNDLEIHQLLGTRRPAMTSYREVSEEFRVLRWQAAHTALHQGVTTLFFVRQ